MKHFSGIDYNHFLDDIRDMYPFSIEEAIVVELVANALDAKTSLIDIHTDPERNVFQLTDNGSGMDARGFENYHNFSTSFKRKGEGIGFARLGAKLALRVSENIVTETRSKNFWSASEWRIERKRNTVHPVWFDREDRSLPHNGTRVAIFLKRKTSPLLSPAEVRRILLGHYLPLMTLAQFYEDRRIYRRLAIRVNGEVVVPPERTPVRSKQIMLHRGRSRKPFAIARFELHAGPLPDDHQGIALATFGKIIKRDPLKQYFKEMDRITGVIEVPELVDALTTSKCDFRKEGTAGSKYYRFSKAAQLEFRAWLEEIQLLERKESVPDRDVRRLQRVVNRIVEDIPDLQQFYGVRSERLGLIQDDAGQDTGAVPPATPRGEREDAGSRVELVRQALEESVSGGRILQPGEELPGSRRLHGGKFGPAIRHLHAPLRPEISWIEGDTVLLNTAHPAYEKAARKKVAEYHELVAVAMAMLREVPTASEKLELLEQFMSGWGRI